MDGKSQRRCALELVTNFVYTAHCTVTSEKGETRVDWVLCFVPFSIAVPSKIAFDVVHRARHTFHASIAPVSLSPIAPNVSVVGTLFTLKKNPQSSDSCSVFSRSGVRRRTNQNEMLLETGRNGVHCCRIRSLTHISNDDSAHANAFDARSLADFCMYVCVCLCVDCAATAARSRAKCVYTIEHNTTVGTKLLNEWKEMVWLWASSGAPERDQSNCVLHARNAIWRMRTECKKYTHFIPTNRHI